MPAFGPSADASQYGENLKKQRELGPVADSSSAYDDDLLAGLRLLGRGTRMKDYEGEAGVGPATGKAVPPEKKATGPATMTAPEGSSVGMAQDFAAQQTPMPTPYGSPWVPGGGSEIPFDESGMTANKVQPDGSQEEVVTPETMPEPVTVDPSESLGQPVPERVQGAMGLGLSSDLERLTAVADASDLITARALTSSPKAMEAVENKAQEGKPMELSEQIALIAMLVAPVALGFALKGEKGALLGGAAAGKGLEVYGKDMAGREELGQKIAAEKELKQMEIAGEEKKAKIKAADVGSQYTQSTVDGVVDGVPGKYRVYSPKTPGDPVLVKMKSGGQDVVPMIQDPVTKEFRTYEPPTKTVTTVTPATKTSPEIVDEEVVTYSPPKKEYPKPEKESFASIFSRKGIPTDGLDQDLLAMDAAGLGMARRHPGENAGDVEIRQKQYAKFQDLIKAKDERDAALADYASKEGITGSRADRKEARETLQAKYTSGNPWKRNQVILQQADHRNAAVYARNDPAVWVNPKDGVAYKSDPFGKMRRSDAQGIDDVGLLYTFIKMLDPGSVVREGEVYMVSSASPLMANMEKLYNRVFAGGAALGKDEREYINRLISAKVASAYSEQQRHENTYQALSEELGVDFRLVQDPVIAVEMKDVETAKRRAIGIPSFKSGDVKGMSKLKEHDVFFIENDDGTFGAYTKEKVDGVYKPRRV